MPANFETILSDKNPELIAAWTSEFSGVENVRVRGGNILMVKADAIVSPANSFGFMDGGLDWSISDLFEWRIHPIVQDVIRNKHNGELLVGQAEIVATGQSHFRYLICAPTMRVPHDVSNTVNSFLAMRAILLAVLSFNMEREKREEDVIQSVAVPGLATGFGAMPYERCARQMRAAYDQVILRTASNRYRNLAEAIVDDKKYKE